MLSPKERTLITLSDLKRCRMTPIFFDTFFNLEKYLDHEQRDPFASQREVDEDGNEVSRKNCLPLLCRVLSTISFFPRFPTGIASPPRNTSSSWRKRETRTTRWNPWKRTKKCKGEKSKAYFPNGGFPSLPGLPLAVKRRPSLAWSARWRPRGPTRLRWSPPPHERHTTATREELRKSITRTVMKSVVARRR